MHRAISIFLYECAIKLIKEGKAYVCDLSPEEIREYRGTLTEPGKNSPYRDRSVEENLDLSPRMTEGEFANGEKVLRAKIDMASPNINMRDPVIYRIAHVSHHQTGDKWCVYPMYDFAHPLSDAAEKVTYSCARSSSRTTDRSTTGSSTLSALKSRRARSSSRALISTTA